MTQGAPVQPSAGTPVRDPTAAAAAAELARRSGVDRHDVVLVLGSGWAALADELGPAGWEEPVVRLPGFPAPTAAGHGGAARSLRRGRLRVLVLLGRVHLYEGHPVRTVTHGVRTAVAAGCRTVLLTNAAGGIRPGLAVGEPVLLADQLDLTARVGDRGPPGSPYAAALRDLARRVDPRLPDGVYAGLPGPHFETPAEIRALRRLGADLVGMSTVHEAAAARAAGAGVLGLSLVSNLAAGVSPAPLSAAEVLAAGRAALPRLTALVAGVLDQLVP
jgi:purine-nucleoside phosphorylase